MGELELEGGGETRGIRLGRRGRRMESRKEVRRCSRTSMELEEEGSREVLGREEEEGSGEAGNDEGPPELDAFVLLDPPAPAFPLLTEPNGKKTPST